MIKVDGVGGRPSAVDFEGFDARFIRVIQPTEFGEFALAEVEAFAAAAPTPEPDDQEPPVIKPLTVTVNPAEDAQISGDGEMCIRDSVRSEASTPGGFRPVRTSHTSPRAPCANSWV